ncbi:MAG: AAA family ATPase [Candidatus Thiodiazotropha taylori]|nr:AAA family ATPase [Candidatus Thiodiazotropha taylori]
MKTQDALTQVSILQGVWNACSILEQLEDIHSSGGMHGEISAQAINFHAKSGKVELLNPGRGRWSSSVSYRPQFLPYISPEQTGRMNRIVDYRTDFYSLGIILFEMLTGELPFKSEDPLELIHQHIAIEAKPPHTIRPEVPEQISTIVRKLIAKNAEDRYQTAYGARYDLEHCINELQKNGTIREFELAQKDFTDKLQVPQRLYGREEEIDALLETFERIVRGNKEALLVAGYSGVGKTALVHELQKPIVARRGSFIQGKFDQFQRDIPYYAWTQAFRSLVTFFLMETDDQLAEKKTQILNVVEPNGKVLTEIIPELELIIGQQPDIPKLGAIETRNRLENTFQQFIAAVASKEHPLVIFLDDMQWVDLPSLNLMKVLLESTELNYCLIIGAYRDNEVDAGHHLMVSIDELVKAGAEIKTISLQNITVDNVNALTADALLVQPSESSSVSNLIHSKTAGNPFFTHKLLHTLAEEKIITFDGTAHRWVWDEFGLQAIDIRDNVVELMVNKLRKLPKAVQEFLKYAACIGNRFEIDTLESVATQAKTDVEDYLMTALSEGIILPVQDSFKFAHDRIQQAAYALIPKDELSGMHASIGRLLKQKADRQGSLNEHIFDITYHFNKGEELLNDEQDSETLVALNRMAGKQAMTVNAYDAAYDYQSAAKRQLVDDPQRHAKALIQINSELAHICYLLRNYDEMKLLVEEVKAAAEDPLDCVDVWDVWLQYYTSEGLHPEALLEGASMLEALGTQLESEIDDMVFAELMELPPMTDPRKLASMRVLNQVISISWSADPDMYKKNCVTMTNLSYRHGNCQESTTGYAFYGGLLCTQGEIERGFMLGKLAVDLAEKLDAKALLPRIQVLYYATVMHWKLPLQETVRLFYKVHMGAIAVGDMEYAGASLVEPGIYEFLSGAKLMDLSARFEDLYKRINLLKQYFQSNYLAPVYQAVLNLSSQSDGDPTELCGKIIDFRERVPALIREGHISLAFVAYHAMTTVAFTLNKYDLALKHGTEGEKHKSGGSGMYFLVSHNFYYSLALLKYSDRCDAAEKAKQLEIVESNQKELKLWAHHSPVNTGHKYLLVKAELARALGNTNAAMQLYEQAISGAQEGGFTQDQALAAELASQFYADLGMGRISHTYLEQAYSSYNEWQAYAKVEQMEAIYGEVLQKQRMPETSSSILDMDTVIKASQTIASEIELEKLIGQMMEIIIENAGAQKGWLLTKEGERWLITAEKDASENKSVLLQSLKMDDQAPISPVIVNYVARTKSALVLDDAQHEGNFTTDPHVLNNQSISLLCLPLLNQGEVSSLLYLENRLIKGAFVQERVELLKLLSSQMAISLDNALLYRDLENRVNERTAELAQSNRELELARQKAEAANRAKSFFLANMSHELRTPLNAILGFSEMLEHDRDTSRDQKKKLTIINRSGDHLLAMINDVLDLSKIEAGRVELEPVAFDLKNLLEDIRRMIEVRATASDLTFNLQIAPDLTTYVKADAGKLRQVLINLLGNAVKFTEQGGFSLRAQTIPIEGDHKQLSLQIEVEDSGPGIPSEQLDRIFEPFSQAGYSSAKARGTGLGLAISRSFVELMGGDIKVDSRLGEGTLFQLEIPVIITEAADLKETASRQSSILGLAPGQPTYRILVVDDNLDNRLLLISLLSEIGFAVRGAEDGEQAIKQFQEWSPHFIWMDIRMPVMDGYESTQRIRELSGGKDVKIVAITASVFKEQKQKILASGCDDILHKPFQSHEIFDTLAALLGVRYSYDEHYSEKDAFVESKALSPESFTDLSDEIKESLIITATLLDMKAFIKALSPLREKHPSLAEGLEELAQDFHFDKILELLGVIRQ